MKIYISADMEGTAGVCSWAQVDPSNTHEYPVYRRYMTKEVNAAIDGARAHGAHEIVVNDSHWDMRNLLWDELPADVRVISGVRKPLSMAEGAQRRFDAAFFTGYHGKAGEPAATLSHTYSDATFYNVRVNGTACTEALLNAAMLGLYGTPVVLVTGDRTTVDNVKAALPWITAVPVKDAIGYYSANSLTPTAACEAIRTGAREALRALPHAKPFTFSPPIELEIETLKTEQADFMELLPRFERIGGRTVRYRHDDYHAIFRAFIAAMRIGGAANLPT
ncbi:MAG TPA: M55 family metallopeptidase [Candidatus Acidoferrales bacterium]|nr:M55 family metallopeptidase [Candidatus Acidoferrales bacterium]